MVVRTNRSLREKMVNKKNLDNTFKILSDLKKNLYEKLSIATVKQLLTLDDDTVNTLLTLDDNMFNKLKKLKESWTINMDALSLKKLKEMGYTSFGSNQLDEKLTLGKFAKYVIGGAIKKKPTTTSSTYLSTQRSYHHVASRTNSSIKPKRKVYRNPKTGARYHLRKSKTTGRMYKQYLPKK